MGAFTPFFTVYMAFMGVRIRTIAVCVDGTNIVLYIITTLFNYVLYCFLKKNQNAPRPEHLPIRGKKCQNV